jgi:hypothetical protein
MFSLGKEGRAMSSPNLLEKKRADLISLNPAWCRREKLYRMCAGCSSDPIRIQGGMIEIKVFLSERVLGDPEWKQQNVIRGLAVQNWLDAVPSATDCRAHIYKREPQVEDGVCVPVRDNLIVGGEINDDAIEQLIDAMKAALRRDWIETKIGEQLFRRSSPRLPQSTN